MKKRSIILIVKKGKGRTVEEYRGVTLMAALYKVYLMVLAEKLKTECEDKMVIPENRTGFRKSMGTIDNIYICVINYMINRQLGKRKMAVAMFVDLRAAFNSVDGRILYKVM